MDASTKPAAATARASILQVQGLTFRYPQRVLFDHWSAGIPPGLTWLRGGEGSGKTTLLRLLSGALPADGGWMEINRIRCDDQPAAYRQRVFWADPKTDAFDTISPSSYFQSLRTAYPAFDTRELGRLIEGFSLAPHVDKPIYMLSTGSKRKVWLAAAFAAGASVTLLDDPFAALDKVSITFAMQLLAAAARWKERACVMAHYEAPGDLPLAATIDLGE